MVSFTKLCTFLLLSSTVAAFGLTPTKSMLKRNVKQVLPLSDIAAELPRGGADEEGTATIPQEVFNLVKSIAGAGVLSLPAGKPH